MRVRQIHFIEISTFIRSILWFYSLMYFIFYLHIFRLGACEAPPALVTTHLGEDMTSFLEGYISKSVFCCCFL